MFSSKRATMFLLPIVVGLLIGLSIFLFSFFHQQSSKSSAFIGEKQYILMSAYEGSKQHLLFIDLASKRSSELGVLDLADNFGFESEPSCGSYLGYNVVSNMTDFCFPDNLNKGFSYFFNSSFNQYLDSYSRVYIPKQLFSFALLDVGGKLEVVGLANQFLELPIIAKGAILGGVDVCPVPADLKPLTGIACSTTSSACELNGDVVDKLVVARSIAQSLGYDLLVTSATRSYQQQTYLFNLYGPSRAALPTCNAPHISGNAVDVVLIKDGVPVAGMSSSDGSMSDISVGKRSDLQSIMCKAGFQRFSGEFWHFEYKTARWSDPSGGDCVLS